MKSKLIKELLDLGDAFERAYPHDEEQTIDNFLAWATGRAIETPTPTLELPRRYVDDDDFPALPTFIAEYMTKASRYVRLYIKKALDVTPLLTFDDFISLIYCAERGSMTKTDLVEATINEKTSGMLVIKRLIDHGLVTQTDNEDDRRSRRITLTAEGLAVLHQIQPAINQASRLVAGDLSEDEQMQLAILLKRFSDFHQPLFLHHKEASLDELSARLTKR